MIKAAYKSSFYRHEYVIKSDTQRFPTTNSKQITLIQWLKPRLAKFHEQAKRTFPFKEVQQNVQTSL